METPLNAVPMPPSKREELKRLAAAATPGPWAYRSQEFDDWGVVRGPLREDGHRFHLAKVTAPYASQEQMQAHREAKTDPYETNARYIAAVSPDVVLASLEYVEALEADNQAQAARLATLEAEAAAAKSGFAELRGQATSLLEDLTNGCVPVKMEPGVKATPYWLGVNAERISTLQWAELKAKELGIEWPIKAIPYAGNLPSAPEAPAAAPLVGEADTCHCDRLYEVTEDDKWIVDLLGSHAECADCGLPLPKNWPTGAPLEREAAAGGKEAGHA